MEAMLNDDDCRLRDEQVSGVECPDLLGVECPDLLEAPPTPEEQVNIVEALLMLPLVMVEAPATTVECDAWRRCVLRISRRMSSRRPESSSWVMVPRRVR